MNNDCPTVEELLKDNPLRLEFDNLLELLDLVVHTNLKDEIIKVISGEGDELLISSPPESLSKEEFKQLAKTKFNKGVEVFISLLNTLTHYAKKEPELIYGFFGNLYTTPIDYKMVKRFPLKEVARVIAFLRGQEVEISDFFGSFFPKPQEVS